MAKKQQQTPKAAPRQPTQSTPQPKKQQEPKQGLSLVMKLSILLVAIACIVYVNTLQNGYVLDDVMVIKENSIVRQGFSGIPELLKTPHLLGHLKLGTDTYRPLSLVMFAMEFQLFGENPAAGHFFNILLFAGCVVALFIFLNKLFNGERTIVAFVAALLFAVHPIHVEVVANIKSRDELLCFFFAFLSLNVLMNYVRDGKATQLALGLFCLFLSFISKESVITFLGIIPLVFFFYKNENRMRSVYITIGTVVVAGIFLGMREAVLNEYNANAPYVVKFLDNFLAKAPNAGSKLATAILLLGYYLRLMLVPTPLICDHSYNSIPFVTFGNIWALLSLLIYLGMGIFAVYRLVKNKKDPWVFGILFYLITLSLFSNIPFLVGAALADRFAFFASAGVCIIIALAFEQWILKMQTKDIAILKSTKALAVLAPLAVLYGFTTIGRNSDWKDNYTLYKTDVAKSPDNTRLNYYMGAELQKQYELTNDPAKQKEIIDEGLGYLKQALLIYPDNTDAQAEIGATYFRAKQYDSAVVHLNRALELNPRQINACTNLGTVYLTQNRFPEALPYYRKTVSINSGHVLGWFNLGVCYVQTQKYDSAVYAFKKTIELDPEYLNHKATEYTAIVYKMMGKNDSSSRYETMARQYNPAFKQ